ncbi:MAG TPA: MlaC/ttg2D family ABC transporter substrate-binding protein [Candidatus Azoamicus sp.]
MRKIFIFLVFWVSLSFADQKNPVYFLEKIVEESRPALISKNDEFLEKTMEKYIHFEEMAMWIVGKSLWSSIDVSKKNLFLIELKKLMLKTYSKTVYYYVDSDISFLNPNLDEKVFENKKRIQINSLMKKNNKNVNISYRLIRQDDDWYVYDVLIEGISILKSLKMQYSEMIRNKGIDYTISKIKSSNKS